MKTWPVSDPPHTLGSSVASCIPGVQLEPQGSKGSILNKVNQYKSSGQNDPRYQFYIQNQHWHHSTSWYPRCESRKMVVNEKKKSMHFIDPTCYNILEFNSKECGEGNVYRCMQVFMLHLPSGPKTVILSKIIKLLNQSRPNTAAANFHQGSDTFSGGKICEYVQLDRTWQVSLTGKTQKSG